jgi:hypothetical protein
LKRVIVPLRVAVIDAPGLDAIGLVTELRAFQPSPQTERELRKEVGKLRAYGKAGRRLLHDMDVYVKGINAYYRANGRAHKPWTRSDVIALNAIKSELFGEGGGAEVEAAQMLDGLTDRLGAGRGYSVWNDLRQRQDPETPVSLPEKFPYAPLPKTRSGNVVLGRSPARSPTATAAMAMPALPHRPLGGDRGGRGGARGVAGSRPERVARGCDP